LFKSDIYHVIKYTVLLNFLFTLDLVWTHFPIGVHKLCKNEPKL